MKLDGFGKIPYLTESRIQLLKNVVIQEKVDGSQFSFGIIDNILRLRGRKVDLTQCNDGQFYMAVSSVRHMRLPNNFIFRAEAVTKPKHNRICYRRCAKKGIVLFDVFDGDNNCNLPQLRVKEWADALDVDYAPILYEGCVHSLEHLAEFFDTNSFLGGAKIEGVVVKGDGILFKFVSPSFSEHKAGRKQVSSDVVKNICEMFDSENMMAKAIQKLRDGGKIKNKPSDIGPILKIVNEDFEQEFGEMVKNLLYQHFRKNILKRLTNNIPDIYKDHLTKNT